MILRDGTPCRNTGANSQPENWLPDMETLKTIALIIVLLAAGIAAHQWWTRADYVPPEKVNEILDENTRVMSAQVRSREEIIEILERESKDAADRIRDFEEEVVAQAEIVGRLSIYRDSVETLNKRLATRDIIRVIEEGQDTIAVFTKTFGDSLFEVKSSVQFSPDSIENRLDLQQLRDIRMT